MEQLKNLNIQNILSYPGVLYTGKFLLTCGYYSFFYGIFTETVEVIGFGPYEIFTQEKYLLPLWLKPANKLIESFNSIAKIFYGGISNGLIGLTWPISIPLIKFIYKSKSN